MAKAKVIYHKQGSKDLKRMIKAAQAVQAKVGILEGTYPDGTPVATVAAAHEFGSPATGLPARPFMRSTVQNKSKDWTEAIGKTLTDNLLNKNGGKVALETLSDLIVADLRASIDEMVEPSLKEATMARKGSSQPLVDTGLLRDSLDAVVGNKDDSGA